MTEYYLPPEFKRKMQALLGEEYQEFVQSYALPKTQGLRVNTLKVDVSHFLAMAPFTLRPLPWCREGFYFGDDARPGKHPYHAAGLYYIQEPSAMAVATLLQPQPGERILDLCAAPGGKATHIAARMKGKGLIIANEYIPARAKILAENLERFGVTNSVVLNEHPQRLAAVFPQYFDRILVDAPCSGEGMFRKDPTACSEWSTANVANCAKRQLEILDSAMSMLKAGGTLVYSTCTFSPEEDEQIVQALLDKYPQLELCSLPTQSLFSSARPEWGNGTNASELAKAVRLWPHRLSGEGHFIAVFKLNTAINSKADRQEGQKKLKAKVATPPVEGIKLFVAFAADNLNGFTADGQFIQFADHLYLSPPGLPDLSGIRVVRPGRHLGVIKKNRFEPSHALALSLTRKLSGKQINLSLDDPQTLAYLQGETLKLSAQKGWNLVTVDGFPLGWGKYDGDLLKNHYPKGLRWV